jgi:hypothetical protein
MQLLAKLISWEGISVGFVAIAIAFIVAGCSTKWEQKVGDYTASVYWGADFEENENE